MVKTTFATTSNVIHAIKNNRFSIGDKLNKPIQNAFLYAIESPKTIYIVKSRLRRFLGFIGVLDFYQVAILNPPTEKNPSWIISIKINSPELQDLIKEITQMCILKVQEDA